MSEVLDIVSNSTYGVMAGVVPSIAMETMGFDSTAAYADFSPPYVDAYVSTPPLQPPEIKWPEPKPVQKYPYQPPPPMDATGDSVSAETGQLLYREDGIYEAPGYSHEFVAEAMAIADALGGPETLGEGAVPSLDPGIYMAPGVDYDLSGAFDIADSMFGGVGLLEGLNPLDIISDN